MTYDHDSDRLSYSKLKVLADDPRLFYDQFVAKTHKQKSTRTMDKGTLLHAMLVEPSKLSGFAFKPRKMRRGTNAYRDWLAEQPAGAIELDERDEAAAIITKDAVLRHPQAAKYFQNFPNFEQPVYGQIHGLDFQAKLDIQHTHLGCVVDLKTASAIDDRSIKWAIRDWSYDLQMATYLDLAQMTEWRWIFVVVSDRPQIRVVKPTADTMASGRAWLWRLCEEYKARLQSGNWRNRYELEESEVEYIRSDEDETPVECNIDIEIGEAAF